MHACFCQAGLAEVAVVAAGSVPSCEVHRIFAFARVRPRMIASFFCQVRREGNIGTPRRSGPCTRRSIVYKYRGRIVVRTVASALRSEVRARQQMLKVTFYLIRLEGLCYASVFFQDVFAARQRRYVLKADRLIFEHVRVGGG